MSYTIRKLSGEPIIVFKAGANYDPETEVEAVVRESNALMDEMTEPVFQIIDFSDVSKMSLTNLMIGTEGAARGEKAPMRHPKVRQAVMVTRDPIIAIAAEALNNDVYGNLHVPVFQNYEEALAYVRAQLK